MILDTSILPQRTPLLLGISGGMDSMTLLHAVWNLRESGRLQGRLLVAHFNHHLRGEESDGDQVFVESEAGRLGIPCFIGHGDARAASLEQSESIETVSRNLRHAFLAETARGQDCGHVVLAHHLDDHVETLLMRLIRGTGGSGLKGIQPVSPSPSDREITLLRPMIHLKREDIRRWATEHKISFREDSSNASMDHDRNRLRHEVIPILNSLGNGRFPNAFIRSCQLMAEESSMTETMAIEWLETKQKSAFQELPLALKRQVLRIQLENLAIPPRAKLIDSLIANHGNPVMFPGRKLVILDKNGGVGLASTEAHEDPITTKELTLEEGFGTFSWQNRDWYWRWVEPGQGLEGITRKKKGAETEEEWLSLDQIKLPLSVTSWNNGDRYQPLGMQGQVKLQDAFINRKIPRERRSSVPVLRDAEGAILWVEHLRPSQQVAVTKTSRKILQIGRKRPDRSNKRQSK